MFELIKRLLDRWDHPGEFEYQRGYRRYLEGVAQAIPNPEPEPPSVADWGPWPSDAEFRRRAIERETAERIKATREERKTLAVGGFNPYLDVSDR